MDSTTLEIFKVTIYKQKNEFQGAMYITPFHITVYATKKGEFQLKKSIFNCHYYELKEIQTFDSLHMTLITTNQKITFGSDKTNQIFKILLRQLKQITRDFPSEQLPTLTIKPQKRETDMKKKIEVLTFNLESEWLQSPISSEYMGNNFLKIYRSYCDYLSIPQCTLFTLFLQKFFRTETKCPNSFRLNSIEEIVSDSRSRSFLDLRPVFSSLKYSTYFRSLDISNVQRKELLPLLSEVVQFNRTISEIFMSNIKHLDGFSKFINALNMNKKIPLQVLDVSKNSLGDKLSRKLVTALSELDHGIVNLKLSDCQITSKGISKLFNSILDYKNIQQSLKILDISGNSIGQVGSKALHKWLQSMTKGSFHLETLNVGKGSLVLNNILDIIQSDFKNKLQELDISGSLLDEKTGSLLAKFIKETKRLQYLNISSTFIPRESLNCLFKEINSNKKIIDLFFNSSLNDFGVKGAEIIAKNLVNCKKIKFLILDENKFTLKGVKLIFESLLTNQSIKHFSIARNVSKNKNKNSSELSEIMENFINNNKTVEDLNLAGGLKHYFLGENLYPFLEGLKNNKIIKRLNISFNQIGDEGLNILSDSLKVNESLTSLRLDDVNGNFTLGGIETFINQIYENKKLQDFPLPFNMIKKFNKKKNLENIKSLKDTIKFVIDRNIRVNLESKKEKNNIFETDVETETRTGTGTGTETGTETETETGSNTDKEKGGEENEDNDSNGKKNKKKKRKKKRRKRKMGHLSSKSFENFDKLVKNQTGFSNIQSINQNSDYYNSILNKHLENKNKEIFIRTNSDKNKNNTTTNNNNNNNNNNETKTKTKTKTKNDLMDIETIEMDETLLNALKENNTLLIKKLIGFSNNKNKKKKKYSIKMVDKKTGSTCFHYACSFGNTELLSFLLLKKKSERIINLKDKMGLTPLHKLMIKNPNKECIILLSDYEVDFNAVDKRGWNTMQLLLRSLEKMKNVDELFSDTNEILLLLLENDCDPNQPDHKGVTCVHLAAGSGFVEPLKLLLQHGGNVNQKDYYDSTPLHKASRNGRIGCVNILLQYGAQINCIDSAGNTAISLARVFGQSKVEEILDPKSRFEYNIVWEHDKEFSQNNQKIAEKDTTYFSYTIVVFGAIKCGKTKFIERFITKLFTVRYFPTIETKHKFKSIVEDTRILINILDVSGDKVYSSFRSNWIRQADGFVLCYSVTDQEKVLQDLEHFYKNIQTIKSNLQENLPLILVSLKNDLKEKKIISEKVGKNLAEKFNCPFLSVSAKANLNVDLAFKLVLMEIKKKNTELKPITDGNEFNILTPKKSHRLFKISNNNENMNNNSSCGSGSSGSNKDDENKRLTISFEQIIKEQSFLEFFHLFLQKEFAEENLMFYKVVTELKQIDTENTQLIKTAVQKIFDNYISTNSQYEINIEYNVRNEIIQKIKKLDSIDQGLFDKAMIQIFEMLKTDSYPKFIKSDFYKQLISSQSKEK
ncbi:leucine-rich repeat isoform f [Anaeramoeba flamelloides]|uniref:Leucine-rich repeat isoform f n=1 Tax=Anaeramoeba flamelloides TaxID=1746091 RepID=A0AAV7Z4G0_9EUKA|nr:leucine-rich repeat isoform f [Anaeramoeba flamelloides]